jgi:hypothetical protein
MAPEKTQGCLRNKEESFPFFKMISRYIDQNYGFQQRPVLFIFGIFTQIICNMANKRTLKKHINAMVFDVIDECLYLQETQEEKAEKAEQLIEEVVSSYNDLIARINTGKNKADFNAVWNDFNERSDGFSEKLNALSAE